MDDFDIIIIGGGAAGIAAGRALARSGLRFHIVEARGRLGGRAWTRADLPAPLDMGCGWLHSADRNPWVGIAGGLDFAIDRSPAPWMRGSSALDIDPPTLAAFSQALADFDARLDRAAQSSAPDRPVAAYLAPGDSWNPMIEAVGGFMSGDPLALVSAADYAAYEDTGVNWRAPAGYGALIAAAGADLPVTLDCEVTRIDHSAAGVRVETPKGVLRARAALLTIPTPALASEKIRFDPPLPEKHEAAANLPLGRAEKLFLAVLDPEIAPTESHGFGRGARSRGEAASFHFRPLGRPVVEAYFAGALARELLAAGPEATLAYALEELASLFGEAARSRFRPIAGSAWAADAFAGGAYSYAKPGCAGARAALAETVNDRLFFAGEACRRHDFSTAHGAHASGVDAADRIIKALAGTVQTSRGAHAAG